MSKKALCFFLIGAVLFTGCSLPNMQFSSGRQKEEEPDVVQSISVSQMTEESCREIVDEMYENVDSYEIDIFNRETGNVLGRQVVMNYGGIKTYEFAGHNSMLILQSDGGDKTSVDRITAADWSVFYDGFSSVDFSESSDEERAGLSEALGTEITNETRFDDLPDSAKKSFVFFTFAAQSEEDDGDYVRVTMIDGGQNLYKTLADMDLPSLFDSKAFVGDDTPYADLSDMSILDTMVTGFARSFVYDGSINTALDMTGYDKQRWELLPVENYKEYEIVDYTELENGKALLRATYQYANTVTDSDGRYSLSGGTNSIYYLVNFDRDVVESVWIGDTVSSEICHIITPIYKDDKKEFVDLKRAFGSVIVESVDESYFRTYRNSTEFSELVNNRKAEWSSEKIRKSFSSVRQDTETRGDGSLDVLGYTLITGKKCFEKWQNYIE